jgi:hypothetical protein
MVPLTGKNMLVIGESQGLGTHMFLIARGARGLARWDGAERRKKGVRGKFERLSHREVFAGGRTL